MSFLEKQAGISCNISKKKNVKANLMGEGIIFFFQIFFRAKQIRLNMRMWIKIKWTWVFKKANSHAHFNVYMAAYQLAL